MVGETPFSAADSLVGYLYQIRIALLLSLKKLPIGTNFTVSVETLDDVAFEVDGGTPQELVQTKHHQKHKATLTDSSVDLWKTLRIWFEEVETSQISYDTFLHLITTAIAPVGSAAAKLRSDDRDVLGALTALERVALTSATSENMPAYEAFLRVPRDKRQTILEMVTIIDGAPLISKIDQEFQKVVFYAVERKYFKSFLERLEGWWVRRVLQQLTTPRDRILADEIEYQLADLREQFKKESLPIDTDLLSFSLDEATRIAHTSSIFALQLELTKASKKRIAAAICDYYRAFEQRSRWMRQGFVHVGEISQYEENLIEEWNLIFLAVKDEIGDTATTEEKEKAAREVLRWAEQNVIPIRPKVTAPFVSRGSFHMLADEQKVGWHPDFKDRLAELLTSKGG